MSIEAQLRESLTWALTWIVGEGRMPSDVGGLPSDQGAFDKADRLVSADWPTGTGKQSPAEPQGDVVEKLARNQWHRLHRAGLVSVPWDEATGWDRDKAIEGATFDLATITPLLPGPSYGLEVRERLEDTAAHFDRQGWFAAAEHVRNVIDALDNPAPSEPREES